ncbi:rhodanese-like domain-containing protein [Phlyctema vagabunda]|uniref:Rhodanese-like domain-containing protein n=1 Tax=Phlyctema vagabunda TaxID=108571 RepID=A0ABR4PYH2_9HELO
MFTIRLTTTRVSSSLVSMTSRRAGGLRIPKKTIYGIAPLSTTSSASPLLTRRPQSQVQAQAQIQSRFYSQQPRETKKYGFADIQSAISKPSADRILIDVREPGELQSTGQIPSAINIPISSQPDSFFISADEFEDRYGFQRPAQDTEVVFYCKAGVRSRAAAELAGQAGWTNVAEYPGSWLDWERNGGEKERTKASGI